MFLKHYMINRQVFSYSLETSIASSLPHNLKMILYIFTEIYKAYKNILLRS